MSLSHGPAYFNCIDIPKSAYSTRNLHLQVEETAPGFFHVEAYDGDVMFEFHPNLTTRDAITKLMEIMANNQVL